MPLITCVKNVCNLPKKATLTVATDPSALAAWKKTQQGSKAEFLQILADRALIKTSDMFQCSIGVEHTQINNEQKAILQVAHDCTVSESDFRETVDGMVKILHDEVEEAKKGVHINFDENTNPYISPDQENQLLPVLKDVGRCSIFIPRWVGTERRVLVPTRPCLDLVQSALSSIGLTLDREPQLWENAKKVGEKVVIDEDIVGSYLFYKLKGVHPLSLDACRELFDSKVIDGADLHYSAPKKRTPDIPLDIKESLEKLYPERTGRAFAQRIERYLSAPQMQLSKRAGPCESLTQPLKSSEEISKEWVWFGDGSSLLVFNPINVATILQKWGYDVTVNPWKQEVERAPSIKVEGLSCSLRDYQVDPICRWTGRVASALQGSSDQPQIKWHEETVQGKKVKVLDSYTPEPALGGIVKAPTGAGKTVIGLVTLATQGVGVPKAEVLK